MTIENGEGKPSAETSSAQENINEQGTVEAPTGEETAVAEAAIEAEASPSQKTYAEETVFEIAEGSEITLQNLLKAGAHFGHQSHRWNPKMAKYIFGEKNGTHILNLDITLELWKQAEKFLEDIANRGGNILFVGTKPQARELVRNTAERVGGFSVTQRWLGGTLSNFETIKRSINRVKKLEELLAKAEEEGSTVRIAKKERLGIRRELEKLEANLGGIRNMRHVPDVLFVIDVAREAIAVREARKLHIPVVALVDSNVDPSLIDYPIPSNDDASKTLKLFVENVAAAFSRGRHSFLSRGADRQQNRSKKAGSDVEVVTRKGSSGEKDAELKDGAELAVSA